MNLARIILNIVAVFVLCHIPRYLHKTYVCHDVSPDHPQVCVGHHRRGHGRHAGELHGEAPPVLPPRLPPLHGVSVPPPASDQLQHQLPHLLRGGHQVTAAVISDLLIFFS